MNRRGFVTSALAGMVPGCAALVTTTVVPVAGRVSLSLREHPGLDRPGGFMRISPQGSREQLYVLALDTGQFATVSPVCKHRGCSVEISGAILECPCHGSRYDRNGRVLRGPTQAPLDRFPTTVSADGVLTILLEAP